MKRVVAAKLEQILEFDSEQEADEFISKMKSGKEEFILMDYDDFGDEESPDLYRIRIVKQYNKSELLKSNLGLYP